MSAASELKAYFTASSGLTALIADRAYPVIIKKGALLPAVVYTEVDGIPQNTLQGHDGGLWNIRYQVDVYADSYDEAHAVAALVKAALPAEGATFKALLLSRSDLYEEQKRVHRVSLDFSVWWKDASI
jgi:hypothetical protein